MRRSHIVAILILLLFPAVLIGAAVSLLTSGFISAEKSKLATIQNTVTGTRQTGQVLAELDQNIVPEFEVNINSSFTKDVSIDGGLEVQGVTIFNDGIEAPNVVYRVTAGDGISLSGQQEVLIQNNGVLSLQGQTGAVTLTPGEGISIDGTTISLDEESRNALGSQPSAGVQNAFRTLLISGQNSITASGADNLTFEAGAGIQLITDPTTKTVRIVNTNTSGGSVAAGWEDTGSAVVLSTDSDFVGIGTSVPTAALDVSGNLRLRGRLVDSNNFTGVPGEVLVASVNGVAWGTVESAISGTAFVNGGNAFGVPAVLGTADAQNLTIMTSSTPRMTIAAAGNIGIGTTSPTATLDIDGTVRLRGALRDGTNSTGSSGNVLLSTSTGTVWGSITGAISGSAFVNNGNAFGVPAVLGTTDGQGLSIITNNLSRFSITSGGLIGLGTNVTNSLVSLPAATVNRASINIAPGTQPASGTQGDMYVAGGNVYFYNGTVWEDITNYWSLNGTDLYYNGGELGLGIASPDEKLEVYDGNIRINTAGTGNLNERKLTWYDDQERWSMGYAPTDSIRALRIKSVGNDVLVVDETGNVGLGVSTPARRLDVNGAMRLATSTQPTTPVSGDIYNDGSNLFYYDGLTWVELTSGGTSSFWNQNGSAIYYSGGNVGIGTSSPSAMLAVGPNNEFQVAGDGTTTINGTLILPELVSGGILKVNGGTSTVDIATAGTDYEVPLNFTSGLSRNTNTVTLGGTLTQNTELNLNSNALYFLTGNVGFGISTPSRLVDVNGVMRLRTTTEPVSGLVGDIYSDGTAVYFYDGTGWQDLLGGGGSDLFTDGGATTYMTSLTDNFALAGNNSSAPFFFDSTNQILTLTNSTTGASFRVNDQLSDTTPFIVDAAGSVGIGTASPARPLTVNGAMRLITTTQPSSGAAGDIYSDGTSLYFHNGTAFQNLSTGASIWQQNGSNIYFNTGLVGVGTNNPLSALHVEALSNPQLRIVDTSTSTAGFMANATGLYTVTNTGALLFRTGVSAGGDWASTGTEQMRITSSGVGIGNTNPQRALHVGGPIRLDTAAEPLTAAAGDIYSSGTSLYFYDGTGWQDLLNGGGASIWTDGGVTSYLTQTTDNMALGGTDSTAPFFFNAAAQLLTLTNTTTGVSFRVNDQLSDPSPFVVDTDGQVGIGTASPGTTLDVNGALTQRGVSSPGVSAASTGRIYFDSTLGKFRVSEAGNAYVDLVSGASTTFNFGGNTFGALATLGTNDNFNLAFETNNSVRMTVETTGDVGIGTTNPAYRLDVNGAIRSSTGGFVFPDGSVQLTAVGAGGGYWAANGTAIYNLNAGNVGIGISNPFAKLDVRTTSNANAYIMGGTSGGNFSQLVLGEGTGSPTTGTYGELLRYSNASLTNAGSLIMTNYNRDILFTTNTGLRADLAINSSGQVGIGTRSQTHPLMVVSPDNSSGTTILGAYANNLTQGVGLSFNQVRAIGSNTDVSLFLNPQGAANVTIFKNNLDFYSSADNIDAAPFLRVFDDYFNNYTPVLRLAESNSGSSMGTSYFQMTSTTGDPILDAVSSANTDARLVLRSQGAGNVTLFRNNLDFYSGADNADAAPLLRVFDDYFNQYAPVLQLVESNSGSQLADNYFQFISSHGSDPILNMVGADTDINLNLNPKGAGDVRIWKNNLDFFSGAANIDAAPIMNVFDDFGDAYRPVVQFYPSDGADNYFQLNSTSGADQFIHVVGPDTDLNLNLNPKGTGRVRVWKNSLDFYSGTNAADAQPILYAFDDFGDAYRPVVQLATADGADNYLQLYSTAGADQFVAARGPDTDLNLVLSAQGAGNVRIDRNDLEFYDGGDVNTIANLRVYDDWSNQFRQVLQMGVDDNAQSFFYMQGTSGDPWLAVDGSALNYNMQLIPKGTGNVRIFRNNLDFYSGANNADAAPFLNVFDDNGDAYRPVVQLVAENSADNYIQLYSTSHSNQHIFAAGPDTDLNLVLGGKGTGNVRIHTNDLEFYDGGDVNTVSNIRVYDEWSNAFRQVMQFSVDDNAQNYIGFNAGSATQSFSVLGASANSGIRFNTMGTGNLYVNAGPGTFSYPTPGTVQGSLHIGANATTADTTTALTFGVGRNSSGSTAQAGIYVQDSTTGTTMRFATTNNYSTGAQTRLTIDQTGNATFTGNLAANQMNLGGSAITNGKLQMHGTTTNVANGPHTYVTTTQDTFPVFNQLNWSHDNISMNFDAYYDGAFRSGSVGSNYQIYKVNNLLNFNYASGVAAGSGVTFQPGMVMNTSGFIGLGHTAPDARLHLADNVASGAIDNLSEYQIILYDGTATSAYGMGVEASTLWFNSGGSDYRWYAAGSQSMHLDSGNLGIGTSSAPSSRLHVVGPQLRWDPSTTTTNSGILFVSGGDSYAEIRAGQVGNYNAYEPLVLNSSPTGYIGIGTTAPRASLDVGGNVNTATPLARMGPGIAFTSTTDSQSWMSSNSWMFNGSTWTRTAASAATMWGSGNNAGAFEVWTTDTASAQNTAPSNTNSRLIVLNNGNVGVGLINPTNRFEVTGNSAVNGNMIINSSGAINQTVNSWGDKWYMAGADIKVGMNQTNTAWQFDIGGTTGLTRYRLNATTVGSINGPIVDFNTSGSSIFYGNVGVGGATPSTFQLEVNGAIGPSADNVNALGSSGRRFTEVFAANGTINTSDQRLKTDIQELQYGLDEILALDTVSYAWKGGNQADRKLGLIAQNLQQIMPEVVHVGSDVNKTLGVYYTDLIPVTIKAIQEQQEQINAMKLKTDEQSIMDKIMALMQSDASQSKEINELNKRVASISAELVQANTTITQAPPVATTSVDLSKLETRTTSLEAEIASLSARLTAMVLGTSTASTSALVENQTSVSDLIVSNTANINDLGVTGSITAGLLSISGMDELGGSSINTLVEPLKLQSLRGGAIEMMGGDFRIETDGTVTIAGTVEAQTVKAETVQTKALEVDRSENENATAGTATIKPGETSVVIKTTSVKADSLIFVTEKTEQFAALIVTGQKDGESFTVKMKEAASGDVTFNWLIVK
jgi:hypothetical protein